MAREENRLRGDSYQLSASEALILETSLEAILPLLSNAAMTYAQAMETAKRNRRRASQILDGVKPVWAQVAEELAKATAIADMEGRLDLLERRGRPPDPAPPGTELPPASEGDRELPSYLRLPFAQAIDDITKRDSRLATSREDVERVYRSYGFAIARSTRKDFTTRVKNKITTSLTEGLDYSDIYADFLDEGFGLGYAETVVRTNVKTATTAGRVQQANHPGSGVLGWLYVAVGDTDTRSTHNAMDGFIASVRSRVWRMWTPPNGYNCRCALEEIDEDEARRLGRIMASGEFRDDPPRGVLPDEGFRFSPVDFVGYETA